MNSPRNNVSSKCVFLQNSTSRSRNSIYLVYPSNFQVMFCQTYDKEAMLSERYKYDHNLIRVRYSMTKMRIIDKTSFIKKILCKAGKPENCFYIHEPCEYGTTRLNSTLNHITQITIRGAHKIFFLKHAAKILNSLNERDQKDYDGLVFMPRIPSSINSSQESFHNFFTE